MPKTYNNTKLDIYLIAEQILTFASWPNMVRDVKILSPSKLSDYVLSY